jgi:hypothetical protein
MRLSRKLIVRYSVLGVYRFRAVNRPGFDLVHGFLTGAQFSLPLEWHLGIEKCSRLFSQGGDVGLTSSFFYIYINVL